MYCAIQTSKCFNYLTLPASPKSLHRLAFQIRCISTSQNCSAHETVHDAATEYRAGAEIWRKSDTVEGAI